MASKDVNDGDSNGLPSDKHQTLTLHQEKHHQRSHHRQESAGDSDGEIETLNGFEFADDAVRHLHQEIEELRRDRSGRHRRMEEMLAEMERSEIGTKALSAHASFLEAELVKTQEDLASAALAAAEAEKLRSEMEKLQRERDAMKEKIADLEAERGRTDGEIRALKEELRVSEERRALKEEELRGRSKEMEMGINELLAESREAIEEQVNIRVSKEEELARVVKAMKERNSELEGDLVHEKSRRGDELEKLVEELKRRNFELKSKIEELSSNANGGTSETIREMEIVKPASSSNVVSWPTTAAVVATTGTIVVAITALYLRRQR